MYTPEERDTFLFCVSRCAPKESDRRGLCAFAEAIEHTDDPRGLTPSQVASLIGRSSRSTIAAVGRLLSELARETREHGVPIAVAEESDGTLRYWLAPEQVRLIRLVLRSRAASPVSQGQS
jgi:hypothetical protein